MGQSNSDSTISVGKLLKIIMTVGNYLKACMAALSSFVLENVTRNFFSSMAIKFIHPCKL